MVPEFLWCHLTSSLGVLARIDEVTNILEMWAPGKGIETYILTLILPTTTAKFNKVKKKNVLFITAYRRANVTYTFFL